MTLQARLTALPLGFLLVGCSTLRQLTFYPNGPQLYGGCRAALDYLDGPTEGEYSHDAMGLYPLCAIDLPFCLALDTVLLPLTIPAEIHSSFESEYEYEENRFYWEWRYQTASTAKPLILEEWKTWPKDKESLEADLTAFYHYLSREKEYLLDFNSHVSKKGLVEYWVKHSRIE